MKLEPALSGGKDFFILLKVSSNADVFGNFSLMGKQNVF